MPRSTIVAAARRGRDVRHRPDAWRHDGKNPLRRFGTRELAEGAGPDFLDRDRVAREIGDQCLAARGAGEVRGHQGALELEARRQRLLDQPDPFEHSQAAAAPRLAALKISDCCLQITGDASPPLPPALVGGTL